MQDDKVLVALADAGDIASMPRKIEHWAYFTDKAAADQYVGWLQENGYYDIQSHAIAGDRPFKVHSAHVGTVEPDDLKGRTWEMAQKVQELGGTYDGWETTVMRGK